MTVVEPQPDDGAPPEPRRQGPPEVEALHAIDRLIGNAETITAEQLGEVRGIVLGTLNAWHTRQREAPDEELDPEAVAAVAAEQAERGP